MAEARAAVEADLRQKEVARAAIAREIEATAAAGAAAQRQGLQQAGKLEQVAARLAAARDAAARETAARKAEAAKAAQLAREGKGLGLEELEARKQALVEKVAEYDEAAKVEQVPPRPDLAPTSPLRSPSST